MEENSRPKQTQLTVPFFVCLIFTEQLVTATDAYIHAQRQKKRPDCQVSFGAKNRIPPLKKKKKGKKKDALCVRSHFKKLSIEQPE